MNKMFSTIVLLLTLSHSFCFSIEIQREAFGIFDNQHNTISNIEFSSTNFGITFLDISNYQGTGIWPRGSQNNYIYSGGIWFGARKLVPDGDVLRNYCVVSYNPNSGNSWMVPG